MLNQQKIPQKCAICKTINDEISLNYLMENKIRRKGYKSHTEKVISKSLS